MAARLILHTDDLDPAALQRFAEQALQVGCEAIRGETRSRRPVLVADVAITSTAMRELMGSHEWRHLMT